MAGYDIGFLMLGSLRSMGGYQVFACNLLQRLHARGHRLRLYVAREELSAQQAFYQAFPFPVTPLLPHTARLLHYVPQIPRAHLCWLQRRYRHQVWQIIGAYPAAYLGCGLAGRVPLVLRAHGDDVQVEPELNYGLRLDPKLDARIRTAVQAMDTVVALTPTMSACYRDLGVSDNRIVEIPNGFDTARFQQQADHAATRAAYGVAPGETFLLTVGRRHKKKNYEVIPAIAKWLAERGLKFSWLVVGKGCDTVAAEAKALGLGHAVRSVEEIGIQPSAEPGQPVEVPGPELVRLYQAADIFVFPSKLETFGRVLVEAMAAGTPVVTTPAPGCRDVTRHNENALHADPDAPEEFADAVLRIVRDEPTRDRLIRAGLESAAACDFEIICDRYVGQYEKLIRNR